VLSRCRITEHQTLFHISNQCASRVKKADTLPVVFLYFIHICKPMYWGQIRPTYSEANSSSSSQIISSFFWNQNFRYHIYKSWIVCILSQMYPVHSLASCFFKIYFITTVNLSLGFTSGFLRPLITYFFLVPILFSIFSQTLWIWDQISVAQYCVHYTIPNTACTL
jgi:hypothetical protein